MFTHPSTTHARRCLTTEITSTKEPGAIESTSVSVAAPDRDIAVCKEVDSTETKYVSEEVLSPVERSSCCESYTQGCSRQESMKVH